MMFKVFLLCLVITMGYSKSVDPRPKVTFPPEVTAKILQELDGCLAEYKIGREAIDEIRNGEFRDDADYQNFIHCAYAKSGFAKDDGHIKVVEGAQLFPPEYNIESVLKKCDSAAQGDTPSAVTLSFFKCFQATTPALMAL